MRVVLLLAFLALLAPLGRAHGDDREEPYDPLTLDLALFADAQGGLVEAKPAAGHVWFRQGEPNQPHPPLDFAFPAPGRLVLQKEARLALAVAMDKPFLPQDKDGNAFEVTLLAGGKPTNVSVKLKLASGNVGVTGAPAPTRVEAKLALPDLPLEKGTPLALRIQPLMPVIPPEGLRLLVGGDAATTLAFMQVRIPGVRDLELQDAPLEEFLLSADPEYRTSAASVHYDLRVDHAAAELGPTEPAAGRRAFLVLRGVEPSADAHAHHESVDPAKRAGLAHHFQVGDRLVRVHPGVGVRVPLQAGADGLSVVVKCVLNCPEGGFERTISLLQPDDPQGATGGTLIPPPRSTKGIPVSADAPAEESKNLLPGPGPLVLLAGAAAGLFRSTRKKL